MRLPEVPPDPRSCSCTDDGGDSCGMDPVRITNPHCVVHGTRAVHTVTPLHEVEAATKLIVEHRYPWCRAKLLHALAGAEEKGILEDVLDELLHYQPEPDAVDKIRQSLEVWRIAEALGAEHVEKVSTRSSVRTEQASAPLAEIGWVTLTVHGPRDHINAFFEAERPCPKECPDAPGHPHEPDDVENAHCNRCGLWLPETSTKFLNDRALMWAHCVSEHAVIMKPDATFAQLQDFHDHEHEGPGTIRNHDPKSRAFSLKKLGQVLSEAEPEDT